MTDPVSALSGQSTTPVATKPTPKTQTTDKPTLDYDNFLQLLVTQLKNQDPLSPMDNTEYVAQLATFSNVEQNILTNDRLADLNALTSLGSAGGIIGHTVTPATGEGGKVVSVKVTSDGAVAVLADGRTLPLGAGLTVS